MMLWEPITLAEVMEGDVVRVNQIELITVQRVVTRDALQVTVLDQHGRERILHHSHHLTRQAWAP